MEYAEHVVREKESIFSIAKHYNTTVDTILNLNYVRYPGLIDNPYMIFYGWTLIVPIISNGGNTDYNS